MIEETAEMKSHDMDFEQLDLFKNIAVGDFPQWNLQILVITEEQANSYNYYLNPFDVTKVWPDRDFSFIDLGVLELNQNAHNYFQDIEQVAFAMAHVVDGIEHSPDKMLQG